MKIIIGSDHGGYALKEIAKRHLLESGCEVEDMGTASEESCHYPVYALAVAEAVAADKEARGILCCGTGVGMSIAANKVKGIRAAVVGDCFTAEAVRRHNDANILCLGERVIGPGLALRIIDIFLCTAFDGGRHEERLRLIADIENR